MKNGTNHTRRVKAVKKIRKRLRKKMKLLKLKLRSTYEEVSEYFASYHWLRLLTENPLVWETSKALYKLRKSISRWRWELAQKHAMKVCRAYDPARKLSGSIHRLRFSIHAAIRGEKCEKKISERGLPESFRYWIEGLEFRNGAVLTIDGRCCDVEHGSYVHIGNDAGIEFIFDIGGLDCIVGDRYAIPDDDYVQIFLWIHRHERELYAAWRDYASPIVNWFGWDLIDRYISYLENRKMQARLNAEFLLSSSKYRQDDRLPMHTRRRIQFPRG